MVYALIVFSYLFESVITNIVHLDSFLIPLFLLTSFTILYPYFKNNKLNFIVTCIVCGLIYDISYTDSVFVSTISFGICGVLIIFCYNYAKYSIYMSNIINILVILFYRVISYLILIIVDYINFDGKILFQGIYNSILINIVYGIVLYLISDVLSKILNVKKE